MKMFYSCLIESVFTFRFAGLGSVGVKNRNRAQGLVKVCGKVAGETVNSLNDLYNVGALKKTRVCAFFFFFF